MTLNFPHTIINRSYFVVYHDYATAQIHASIYAVAGRVKARATGPRTSPRISPHGIFSRVRFAPSVCIQDWVSAQADEPISPDVSTVPGDVFTVGPEFRVAPSRDDYETDRFPVDLLVSRARRYMPGLEVPDVQLDYAGIMVHLKGVTDWIVRRDERHPSLIQLLGIDSPGLTCCVEIGKLVRKMLVG